MFKKINIITGFQFEKNCIELLKKSWMNEAFLMNNNIKCVILFKSWFFKFCKKEKICSENLEPSPHGCREPDLALIINSCIFILEFKHQGRSGSVSEKLQTSLFK